ncbi:hypothetical protein C7B69_07740 [filamentous cyanobacterium Phorm 46]|nr:hypothetical protein C7B69_07740 [filamentous cyanobacterium Phorm 46]
MRLIGLNCISLIFQLHRSVQLSSGAMTRDDRVLPDYALGKQSLRSHHFSPCLQQAEQPNQIIIIILILL